MMARLILVQRSSGQPRIRAYGWSVKRMLAHLPPGRMPAFRLGWNLLCGIPLLAPDFLYETHVDHHRRTAYDEDS